MNRLLQIDTSRDCAGDVRPRISVVGGVVVVDIEEFDEAGHVRAHIGRDVYPSLRGLGGYLGRLVDEYQKIAALI